MDHPQCSGVRPPDDFDTVVHKIKVLLTLWTQMERERVPLHEMANLIEYLTHEPLARATTAPAMYKEFDALTDNLKILFELHRELQHKGLSVQGVHQSIRVWVGGPLTSAAIGPESNPNLVQSVDEAPEEVTNAEASTGTTPSSPSLLAANVALIKGKAPKQASNAEASTRTTPSSPTLLAANVGPIKSEAPKKATNAEASTGSILSSPASPAPHLRHTMGEAPKKATNAEASTGSIQSSPTPPAPHLRPTMGEAPKKATNAEASTGSIQSSPAPLATNVGPIKGKAPSRETYGEIVRGNSPSRSATVHRWNHFSTKRPFMPRKPLPTQIAKVDHVEPNVHTASVAQEPQPNEHEGKPSKPTTVHRWNHFSTERPFIPRNSLPTPSAIVDHAEPNVHTASVTQKPQRSEHESTDVSKPTPFVTLIVSASKKEREKTGLLGNVPEEIFKCLITPLNHRDRVALSATNSAHFNGINRHVAIWRTQKFEYPIMAEYNPESQQFSTREMDSPSHVLFADVWMPSADKYYLDTKDGRTTTHNREIVANYESNYREDLLRAVQNMIKTHASIKNLSFVRNEELTPNVLNRILEAMPTVEYVSLIHCQQFNYETLYSHDVSDSVPDLYLECSIPHNFNEGPLRGADWIALLWVYLQRYRALMTGETLERDEDTDSEAEAYGTTTASNAPIRPPQDQNHIVGVGPSAGSLLGNQMKNNPRFLRDFSEQLIGKRAGGPKLVENMITGKTEPLELATILHNRIGTGKALDPRSKAGRFHYCSDCSQRLSGLSFANKQFKKRDEDPTCIACHAEGYGEPPFRVSDWRLKDALVWKVSKPLETQFNEVCPLNLLGKKCRCDLVKVDLKGDASLYEEKPWLQPSCTAFLIGQCTDKDCGKAHNYLIERRRMASEIRLQDHALLGHKASSSKDAA